VQGEVRAEHEPEAEIRFSKDEGATVVLHDHKTYLWMGDESAKTRPEATA